MLRKITRFGSMACGRSAATGRSATIYRDVERDEFRVRFATEIDGPLCESADYHTGALDDAIRTAIAWVQDRAEALGNLA